MEISSCVLPDGTGSNGRLEGDRIATGIPSGVRLFRDPEVFVTPGDLVEVEIDGIGTLSNPIKDET